MLIIAYCMCVYNINNMHLKSFLGIYRMPNDIWYLCFCCFSMPTTWKTPGTLCVTKRHVFRQSRAVTFLALSGPELCTIVLFLPRKGFSLDLNESSKFSGSDAREGFRLCTLRALSLREWSWHMSHKETRWGTQNSWAVTSSSPLESTTLSMLPGGL